MSEPTAAVRIRELTAENEFLRSRCLQLSTAVDNLALQLSELQKQMVNSEKAKEPEE